MSRSLFRPLLLIAAVCALTIGVTVALRAGSEPARAANNGEFIIDILPNSFNPPVCQVNRSNFGGQTIVRFRNKDTKPRRMIVPDISTEPTAPLAFDTGLIPPNTISEWSVGITSPTELTFRDADDHTKTVKIISPLDPNIISNCDQLPPTPTPTPTRTPTPVPTPRQWPPACTGLAPVSRQPITGCAVAADIVQESGPDAP